MSDTKNNILGDSKEILTVIEELIKFSAQKFEFAGGMLYPLSNQLNNLIDELELLNNVVLSKGYTETLDKVNDITSDFVKYISTDGNYFENNKKVIAEINAKIIFLNDSLSEFKRVLKSLEFVRVNIKIENSRIAKNNLDFDDVSKTIEKLCGVIKEIIKSFENNLDSVKTNLNESLDEIELTKKLSINFRALIESSLNESVNIISEKQEKISDSLKNSSAIFSEINNEINQIIVLIQYNDIATQRLEHIITAINELLAQIKNTDDGDNLNEILTLAYFTFKLQREQFSGAYAEIKNAYKNISEMLAGILMNLNALSNGNIKCNNIIKPSITNEFDDLKNIFINNTDYVNKFYSITSKSEDLLIRIFDKITNLKTFLEEINEIRSEISLLAINSEIYSFQLRSESLTLSVLSNEMYKIAANTKSISNNNIKQIESINTVAVDIKNSYEILKKMKNDFADNRFEKRYENLIESLTNINSNSNEATKKFDKTITETKNALNEIRNNFRKYDDINSAFSNADNAFKGLIENINCALDGYNYEYNGVRLKEQYSTYTMEKERIVHNRIFNESNKKLIATPNFNKNSNEFGENIELF